MLRAAAAFLEKKARESAPAAPMSRALTASAAPAGDGPSRAASGVPGGGADSRSITAAPRAPTAAPASLAPANGAAAPRAGDGLALKKVATLLVLELKRVGNVPPHVPALLTRLLMTALDDVQGLRTTGVDDVQAMLDIERKKDLIGCGTTACMAEIAGALGTDMVLHGELGILGKRYNVNLTLVGSTGRVRGRVSWLVDASEDTIADRLPELVRLIVDKVDAPRGTQDR
jgi:hypothetical protein